MHLRSNVTSFWYNCGIVGQMFSPWRRSINFWRVHKLNGTGHVVFLVTPWSFQFKYNHLVLLTLGLQQSRGHVQGDLDYTVMTHFSKVTWSVVITCGPTIGQYLPRLKPLMKAIPLVQLSSLKKVSLATESSQGSFKVPFQKLPCPEV